MTHAERLIVLRLFQKVLRCEQTAGTGSAPRTETLRDLNRMFGTTIANRARAVSWVAADIAKTIDDLCDAKGEMT